MNHGSSKARDAGQVTGGAARASWTQWYRWLESRRGFLITAPVLVFLVLMLGSAMRNPVDHDSFWHAQMGEDWLQNGLTPYRDHYSFTYKGEPVKGPPVAFQAWLYLMEEALGESAGMVVVKLVSFYLVFACMVLWLRQLKAPVLVYWLALAMLVLLLQTRSQVRPELLSYSFSILALMLYQRTRLQLSARTILPIALLLLLWTNYHNSILGYIIFFGLFVDIAIRQLREKAPLQQWLNWCAWGALLVAVGFVNRDLAHPAIGAWMFPDYWKAHIREYLSPIKFYAGHWAIRYFMLPLAVITLLAALRRGMIGYAIVGAIVLYSALTIGRMVAPGGIILVGLFAGVFATSINREPEVKPGWQFHAGGLVSLVILFVVMWESVVFARYNLFNNQHLLQRYPVDMVEYMKTNERYGHVFNEYSIGGYLIERLYPEVEVYIDGRTNMLYPPAHFQKFMEARYDSFLMSREIEQYDIRNVVLGNKPFDPLMMAGVDGFALDYVDVEYSLYTKETPGLPSTGELWARPACANNEALLRAAVAELNAITPSLYSSAPVIPAIAVVSDYIAQGDKEKWLARLDADKVPSDFPKRFAAYRAIELGLDEVAVSLLNAVGLKVYSDELALAFVYARQGRFTEADAALNQIFELNRDWWMFEPKDYAVMALITDMMDTGSDRQAFDRAFADKITAKVQQHGLGQVKDDSNIPALFCGHKPGAA